MGIPEGLSRDTRETYWGHQRDSVRTSGDSVGTPEGLSEDIKGLSWDTRGTQWGHQRDSVRIPTGLSGDIRGTQWGYQRDS